MKKGNYVQPVYYVCEFENDVVRTSNVVVDDGDVGKTFDDVIGN